MRLKPGRDKRIRAGHPWAYSDEIETGEATRALPPGGLVTLASADGSALGIATYNPHPLIAARLLSRDPRAEIDTAFIARRLQRALDLRERLFEGPFYRLVHGEADGLAGLTLDRYGDTVVAQMTTAGMDRFSPMVLEALDEVVRPGVVVLKNDRSVREMEGLESSIKVAKGRLEGATELVENGTRFLVDAIEGQKTGWFYDQRDNRAFMARLSRGRRVADFYCYAGGFSIQAAVAGASEVVAVDRSADALALAARSAELNGVAERCAFVRSEVFAELKRLAEAGERFDIVIADPPAFVKSRKDLAVGLKGYQKLFRSAAALVRPAGLLFVASCSHNVDEELFAAQVRHALRRAGRNGRIIRSAGAAPDHPLHPFLPESGYLKAAVLELD
ncbi:MAG: class I SAM-dependent rRNA methyltransferase [Alphaproteobacteria bacterium]